MANNRSIRHSDGESPSRASRRVERGNRRRRLEYLLAMESHTERGGGVQDATVPELVVFDLDMCAWSPEMFTLHKPPTIAVPGDLGHAADPSMLPAAGTPVGMAVAGRLMKGVVGASNGQDTVRLFPGALAALQEVAVGKYPGMRIAVASSADNENAVACAKASLALLEVLPDLTFQQLLTRGFEDIDEGNVQIGRSAPLSSDKTTHFNLLKKHTGIGFDKMLFFDDVCSEHLSHLPDSCILVAPAY